MNTTSATMNQTPSRSGIAWKVTLILIPLVTLGLLLWLRNVEVAALRAVWFSAISRQDLDRRFHLHDLSGAVPDDQQPNERAATALGKNRRASGLI